MIRRRMRSRGGREGSVKLRAEVVAGCAPRIVGAFDRRAGLL
jgi:hypothetical protein